MMFGTVRAMTWLWPSWCCKPFAGQRRASGGAAHEEPAASHVGSRPDQVADTLEAEHRVINEERNRVDAVIGIGGAGCDERAHRAGFGDSFFENLPVLRFLVVEERVHVDGFVELARRWSRCPPGGTALPCRRCGLRPE